MLPPGFRALGQSRRRNSSTSELMVIENEVSTVVINSRHPLFLKRGGDIWYQLETAAREVS
jgi:hypothetical protein